MRIAVVGATGNVGTAVIRALKHAPEVTSVVGVARRLPDVDSEPFSGCEWETADIGAGSTHEEALADLTRVFDGADAVIHLAWLIQPNTNRDLLRRVNVEGTQRVAQAAVDAGVEHLVVASSVGAYAPGTGNRRRDESWPATGISTSHYSVDKAAQEATLDAFAAEFPHLLITRLRPALTFQGSAASSIQRQFLGSWMPLQLLRSGKLPFLPVPRGLRIQAVHADDVGRAYAAAVVKRAPGVFNICADDVLGPQELADIVDHGRSVGVPPVVLRAGMALGHKTRLVAADEGWLDMAMQVPLMDNARAKAELGWTPEHSAADALRELLHGMAQGRGDDSVPMRERDPEDARPDPVDESDHDVVPPTAHVPETISRDLLSLYLSDHLTGAVAGSERIMNMAESYMDTPVFPQLSTVADEIRSERAFLGNLLDSLGFRRLPHRQAASWVAERAARLKLNRRLLTRSPMTLVLEAELMRSAVMGKLGGWQVMEELADDLGLDPQVFTELAGNAHHQLELLDEVHAYAKKRSFHAERKIYDARVS